MKSGYDQFFKSARQNNVAPGKKFQPRAKPASAQSEKSKSHLKSNSKPHEISEKNLRHILPQKSKKKSMSWKMITISFVGFIVALMGYQNHEKLESLIKRVEIDILGTAMAETETKKNAADTKKSEKSSDKASAEKSQAAEVEKVTHSDDASNLDYLQKLNERKKGLDAREQELARQEEELQKQRVEIDKRLEELKELRGQISTVLDDRVKVDEQKVDTLVQTYSNMKPPQAAKILEAMDEDLAVEILGRMKKKNAADVMNLIKPEKAQIISEKFAGYKRKPAAANSVAPTNAKSPVNNSETNNSNKN